MNRPVAKRFVILRVARDVVGKPLEQVLWGIRAVKIYRTRQAAELEAARLSQLNTGEHYFVSNANAPEEPVEDARERPASG
jgi:hypothetical protein